MTPWESAWRAGVTATAQATATALAPPNAQIKRVWLWSGYRRIGRLVIRWRRRVI